MQNQIPLKLKTKCSMNCISNSLKMFLKHFVRWNFGCLRKREASGQWAGMREHRMETKNTPESKGGRESSLRIDTEAKQSKMEMSSQSQWSWQTQRSGKCSRTGKQASRTTDTPTGTYVIWLWAPRRKQHLNFQTEDTQSSYSYSTS